MLNMFIKKEKKFADLGCAIKKANETLPIWIAGLLKSEKTNEAITSVRKDIEGFLFNYKTNISNNTQNPSQDALQNEELIAKLRSYKRNSKTPTSISEFIKNYFFYPQYLASPEETFEGYLKDDTIGASLMVYTKISKDCFELNSTIGGFSIPLLWLIKLIKNLNMNVNPLAFHVTNQNGNLAQSTLFEVATKTTFLDSNLKIANDNHWDVLSLTTHTKFYSELYEILKELEKSFPGILNNQDYIAVKQLLKLHYKLIPSFIEVRNMQNNRLNYIKNPDAYEEREVQKALEDTPKVNHIDNKNVEHFVITQKSNYLHADRNIEGFDLVAFHTEINKSNDPYLALFDSKIKSNEAYQYKGLEDFYSEYINYDSYLQNQLPQPFEFKFTPPEERKNSENEIYSLQVNNYAKFYDFFIKDTKSSELFESEIQSLIGNKSLTSLDFMHRRIRFVSQLMTLIRYNTIIFSNTKPFIKKLCDIEVEPSLLAIKEVLDTFTLAEARCPEFTNLFFYTTTKEFYQQLFEEAKFIANKTNLTFTQLVVYESLCRQNKLAPTFDYYHFAGFIVRGLPVNGMPENRIAYLEEHSPEKNEPQIKVACALYRDTFQFLKDAR